MTNVPNTIMRLMHYVLRIFIANFVGVYFDNILVYSLVVHEHLHHLRTVFETLKNVTLFVHKEQCVLRMNNVNFFSLVLSDKEAQADHEKVKVRRD